MISSTYTLLGKSAAGNPLVVTYNGTGSGRDGIPAIAKDTVLNTFWDVQQQRAKFQLMLTVVYQQTLSSSCRNLLHKVEVNRHI